jgi:hypothetical protein
MVGLERALSFKSGFSRTPKTRKPFISIDALRNSLNFWHAENTVVFLSKSRSFLVF